jgi:hypothetical protein
MLAFHRVHALVVNFFARIWTESGATGMDFARLSALVRSNAKQALSNQASKTWVEVERYAAVVIEITYPILKLESTATFKRRNTVTSGIGR